LVWAKAEKTGSIPGSRWLFQVLRHELGDWYRRNGRIKEIPVDNASFNDIADAMAASPEETWETKAVREVLRNLKPAHSEALRLHYLAGLTASEAAPACGISYYAAMKRLSRARRAFINAFNNAYPNRQAKLTNLQGKRA
jgi:RNA polymerase sigma factor (sigma-70 family)